MHRISKSALYPQGIKLIGPYTRVRNGRLELVRPYVRRDPIRLNVR